MKRWESDKEACPHLSNEQVVGFLLDRMTENEEAEIYSHLDICGECADDMAHMTGVLLESDHSKEARPAKVISAFEKGWDKLMKDHSQKEEKRRDGVQTWANIQKHLDTDIKRMLAEWAIQYFKLNSGAPGVYCDAGSSNLYVWERLAEQIRKGYSTQTKVVTNNLMILSHFANDPSPLLHGAKMEVAGDIFDGLHQALFGRRSILRKLQSLHADVSYIGTNGFSFGEDGSILFGYHAELEREVKCLLFENHCNARARVILATPRKIGNPGSTVIDILKLKRLDVRYPLYLVTAPPMPGEREAYETAMRIYRSAKVQKEIEARDLNFIWLEVRGPNAGDEYNITEAVHHDRVYLEESCSTTVRPKA
jgi:hypothetical protein